MAENISKEITLPELKVSLLPLSEYSEIIARGRLAISNFKKIDNDVTYDKALDVVKRGKMLISQVNDTVEKMTRPLKDAKKLIDSKQDDIKTQADTMLKEFRTMLGLLESLTIGFYNEKKRLADLAAAKQREELAALNKKIEEDSLAGKEIKPETIQKVVETFTPVANVSKPKGLKTIWKYEITNDLLVPRAYCIPSPGLLQQAVRDGEREIPGVRIFESQGL